MKRLHIAETEAVLGGEVTDIYFLRTAEILESRGAGRHVCMEVFLKAFPQSHQTWGIFGGLEEALVLLAGRPVSVTALPEGTLFHAGTPVMTIEGDYLDFGEFETAVLGCLCQASGIATKAARCRVACGDKTLVSFGARRMHPAIAPMVERAAFIGGCNGVATVASARLIGEEPMGTMPHTLVLQLGDTVTAARAFDEIIDPAVARVVLIDTFQDEKFEALRVAEALGPRLFGVRLDTPSSRRGNFRAILEEVRWELDSHGFGHVKLFVSGGLGEKDIIALSDIVDAFGVGTSISSAATLDYSMDIVAIEGQAFSKRGKWSGRKSVLRCPECRREYVVPFDPAAGPLAACGCGAQTESLLQPLIENGALVRELPTAQDIRCLTLQNLADLVRDRSRAAVLGLPAAQASAG